MITNELKISLLENNVTELSFPREKDVPIRDKFILAYRGKNRWAILNGMKSCWSKKEKVFVYEPIPSSRDDKFFEECRFNFEEGLRIIEGLIHVPHNKSTKR